MRNKQFKAESKRLLDLMINSIYTHKEIFLRELISNSSDAIDKLYFRSLTDDTVGMNKGDFKIRIDVDKDARLLSISDNGIGMTAEELESNLGTIAKSGSLDFKKENDSVKDVDIIGQFGVGFYSAFMVADDVTVKSRAFGSDTANCWHSKGIDGYTVEPCDKEDTGTVVILHIKESTDEENYDEFLEKYRIESLVKKYSDYIRYPILMDMETTVPKKDGKEGETETVTETRTLNSMVPLWKKSKKSIKDEEYSAFYKEKFYDYTDPLRVIHYKTEGSATFTALLFVPKTAPYNYYSKEYKKGLALYSKGVLITERCEDLLPDCYSFMRGLVDSEDLSLNISREMLQHDNQLKIIAKNIEKKIKTELEKMLKDDRDKYEEFFKAFGIQLKFGVYSDYGMHKDELQDLLLFYSSTEKKPVTLAEYVSRMKEDDKSIYYACGDSIEKIEALPQIEALRENGTEILYCTEYVDEFALKMMHEYKEKEFVNACASGSGAASEEDKKANEQYNTDNSGLLEAIKKVLEGKVEDVRFTSRLKNHPVCLTSEGEVSLEMEKVLGSMPGSPDAQKVKAQTVLEINKDNPIAAKLIAVFAQDAESVDKYAKVLYDQARLAAGMTIDDPALFSELVSELMSK